MTKETKQQTLEDYLVRHARGGRVSFHMPGHKGAALFRETGHGDFLDALADTDITEIPGADNLFDPEGVIGTTQAKYRALYGAKESYLQVNGSSGALIASILATVPKGGKLIVARNCHKAVFNALLLGDITPVYVQPDILADTGICGKVSARAIEEALAAHPDASGAIITSPNYYGILSDIEAIAKVLHDLDKVLIVDQAHGAHLVFFERWPLANADHLATLETTAEAGQPASPIRSAEGAGADIIADSIHKTLAGFTQSALLNVMTDRVDTALLQDKLQMIESSSPSYLLMGGLDVNVSILEQYGEQLITDWQAHLAYFYEEAAKIPGLSVLSDPDLEISKISVGFPRTYTGEELEQVLADDYAIDIEIPLEHHVMCLTGIGNTGEDYDRLLLALRDIAEQIQTQGAKDDEASTGDTPAGETAENETGKAIAVMGTLHEVAPLPLQKERVALADAVGRICATPIVPYPPGIPLVCPGEIVTAEDLRYIQEALAGGTTILGIAEGHVTVGK